MPGRVRCWQRRPAPLLPAAPAGTARLSHGALREFPSGPAPVGRFGPLGVPLPTGRTRRVALRARGSSGRAAPAPPSAPGRLCPARAQKGTGSNGEAANRSRKNHWCANGEEVRARCRAFCSAANGMCEWGALPPAEGELVRRGRQLEAALSAQTHACTSSCLEG